MVNFKYSKFKFDNVNEYHTYRLLEFLLRFFFFHQTFLLNFKKIVKTVKSYICLKYYFILLRALKNIVLL